MKAIKAAGKRMVKQVEVFDVYQGEHVESGKKSVALSITYQSEDHTADRSGNSGRASDGSGSSGKGLPGCAARLIHNSVFEQDPVKIGSLFMQKDVKLSCMESLMKPWLIISFIRRYIFFRTLKNSEIPSCL